MESNHLTLLIKREVLVGIHQAVDTVLAGSYATNREAPATVRTRHTVERQFVKSRIVQVGMQSDQDTFDRFQIGCIQYRSGHFHRINLCTGREGKREVTQRITLIVIDNGVREINGISSVRLQRVKQIHLYPLS